MVYLYAESPIQPLDSEVDPTTPWSQVRRIKSRRGWKNRNIEERGKI